MITSGSRLSGISLWLGAGVVSLCIGGGLTTGPGTAHADGASSASRGGNPSATNAKAGPTTSGQPTKSAATAAASSPGRNAHSRQHSAPQSTAGPTAASGSSAPSAAGGGASAPAAPASTATASTTETARLATTVTAPAGNPTGPAAAKPTSGTSQGAPSLSVPAVSAAAAPAPVNLLSVASGLFSGLLGLLGATQLAAAQPGIRTASTSGATRIATSSRAAAPPAPTKVVGSAGLTIDLVWDSSVAKAPTTFTAAIIQAATEIGAVVSNKITVNIDVGYGEIAGQRIGSGTAETETLGDKQESYATVKQQLTKADTTAIGKSVVANLPATSPFGSLTYDVAGAQLQVFGVLPAIGTAADAAVGFSTDWSGNPLLAAALHELTHALGRNSGWGSAAKGYDVTPMDLARFSAPGVWAGDGSPSKTRMKLQYFSVNGGKTVLADFDNKSDYGDWTTNSLTPTDAFDAYIATNPVTTLSTVDIDVLDAIGYTTG